MPEEKECPQCGNTYTNIGQHWSMSSSCEHPPYTPRQYEILTGFLLNNGSVQLGSGYPSFRITTQNRDLLEFLRDEFGILSNEIYIDYTAEEVREQFEERGWTVSDPDPIYGLNLLSHPDLRRFRDQWYTEVDGEMQKDVPDVEPTKRVLKTFFVTTGRTFTKNGKEAVKFPVKTVNASDDFFAEFFSEFNPRLYRDSSKDTRDIILRDSASFFDVIGEPEGSFSRFSGKWPDGEYPLIDDDSPGDVCPSCGQRFTLLSAHWGSEPGCDFPDLTDRQQSVVWGLLLGGAPIFRTGEQKRHHIVVESTNRAFLEWVDSELGFLCSSIHEATRNPSQDSSGNWIDRPLDSFGEVYRLQTRSHPYIERIKTEVVVRDDESFVLPEFFTESPKVLETLYAYRGKFLTVNSRKLPAIRLTQLRLTEDDLLDLFSDFPTAIYHGVETTYLVVKDTELFFDVCGSLPQSLLHHVHRERPRKSTK